MTKYGKNGEKLYPFSMEKNAHNFQLIANRAYILMREMEDGDRAWNDNEYDRLEKLHDEANKYMCYGPGIVWVSGKTYGRMKELSTMAQEYRIQSCIRAGRNQDIQYC